MRHRAMPTWLWSGWILVTATGSALAVSSGQFDDFNDGTTQGWQIGTGPITHVPSGSPADDGYAEYSSFGGGGPASRMVVFNTSQWSGDFVAAGVTEVTTFVNNLGSSMLDLRLAFGDSISGFAGSWFASSMSVPVAPGSGWVSVSFPIGSGDVTQVQGAASYSAVLGSVASMRLLSSTVPDHRGDVMSGTIGFDNFTAGAEPLPVTLSRWQVERAGSGVELLWRTESEIDNLGFHVYRIQDGTRERLNTELIPGQGTSTTPHEYRWLDARPPSGRARYLLEEVALDGTTTYHPPLSSPAGR